MVRAFTADSLLQAQRYVAILQRYGIEAVVKEARAKDAADTVAEVWLTNPQCLHRAQEVITGDRLGAWVQDVPVSSEAVEHTPVCAFIAKDQQEANHYLEVLRQGGIKAEVRQPAPSMESPPRPAYPEIWVPKSRLPEARAAYAGFETWKRENPRNPFLTWRISVGLLSAAFTIILLARVGFGLVLGTGWDWVFLPVILFAVSLGVLHQGLALFRQFVWVDQLAIVSFLPAAWGLTLREYGDAMSAPMWGAQVSFTLISLVLWVGTVGLMNREKLRALGYPCARVPPAGLLLVRGAGSGQGLLRG
jgi:hypothetical protein